MRILGIDPGYGITGFGVVEAQAGQYRLINCGAITTPANTEFSWRLTVIYNDMTQLLQVSRPDAVAIEELFFGQNVTTGINVAQARGVILLAVAQAGIPLFEYKPMQVKQSLVGYGNATKHQMQDNGYDGVCFHAGRQPGTYTGGLATHPCAILCGCRTAGGLFQTDVGGGIGTDAWTIHCPVGLCIV